MSDESFVEMYHATYYSLLGYVSATAFDKNLVEDIIQETYQAAFMKQDILEGHDNAIGWLMLTAKYKMMKMQSIELKHLSVKVGNEDYLLDNAHSGGEEALRLLELESVLYKELNAEERELLFRYYIGGYTYKELTKIYKVSVSCLKMRLKRIRDKLITCM